MSPITYAARLGLVRGWHEFRQSLTAPQDIGYNIFFSAVFVMVMYFQRNSAVEGIPISLAMLTLPSVLGMMVGVGGIVGTASQLAIEREDGTLLRAKAIPNGMIGYLVGRVVLISLQAAPVLLIIVVPGLFLLPELAAAGVMSWLTLIGIIVLGMLATMPWGAILGSLLKGPNAVFGLTMLPLMGLTAISGIFYPISALPGWVQAIAQVFPLYWLGLGTRAAILPDAAMAAEIGGSWRHLETLGVLGLWAVAGLLIAPAVLRRMARRESGAAMAERREAAMRRYGA